MSKIHKIKISVVGDRWEEIEVATGSIEIDRNGDVTEHCLNRVPMNRLFMFKPETSLNITVENGEEKKSESDE